MGFLSWFLGRRPPPPPEEKGPEQPAPRSVRIEWEDSAGSKVVHETTMVMDEAGKMIAIVPQRPPSELVQIREKSSPYPAETLSIHPVDGGFKLTMDYLWEGRRREKRLPVEGPAFIEREGLGPLPVEVLNVSPGGIQIFSEVELKEGISARITGSGVERISLVRYCAKVAGGYRVGLQFFGDDPTDRN